MQEHIRRAHPEYYIPKLPATKESFDLMVNSTPQERPLQQQSWSPPSQRRNQQYSQDGQVSDTAGLSTMPAYNNNYDFQSNSFGEGAVQMPDSGYYGNEIAFEIARSSGDFRRGSLIPAASAAAALAQLHYARPDGGWDGDQVRKKTNHIVKHYSSHIQNFYSDQVGDDVKGGGYDDPTLAEQQFLNDQYTTNSAGPVQTPHLMPSSLARSPPGRSTTLPPSQRSLSRTNRPRRSSLSREARKAKHERQRSKEQMRLDRKAYSAEPSAAALYGKRWEDLIDAATSATEEDSRDLTPVMPPFPQPSRFVSVYPLLTHIQIPASPYHSPQVASRTSLPPFALGSQFQSYTASPLQHALTPPPADDHPLGLNPFPSVENESVPNSIDSNASGTNFHIMPSAHALSSASDSSPMFSNPVQIYCAACRRLSVLKESFACPECICGVCAQCVEALISEQARGRMTQCPKCRSMGMRFKPFQLDIR